MKKMKVREFWDSQDTDSKNKIVIEMTAKCSKSFQTIQAWMLGYRAPSGLDKEALYSYLKENYQVEIIEEGGAQ